VTSLSSAALADELGSLITAMSSAAQLQFVDVNGNVVAACSLGNPPAAIVGNGLVLLGLPEYATVYGSSVTSPVDQILSANVVNSAGTPILQGINVYVPNNQIALASSTVTPGGQLGVIGGAITLP
jgi:hypothetical protein